MSGDGMQISFARRNSAPQLSLSSFPLPARPAFPFSFNHHEDSEPDFFYLTVFLISFAQSEVRKQKRKKVTLSWNNKLRRFLATARVHVRINEFFISESRAWTSGSTSMGIMTSNYVKE